MDITFCGGAREVGASCAVINTYIYNILNISEKIQNAKFYYII
ncbi:hypothetical protein [Iocasia frigidifontis]|nr:hypothetical protein [Iocasia fonsfrigidae]